MAAAAATETTKASSLLGELEIDVEIKSPAKKFFHTFANKTNHLSKLTRYIQGLQLVEGEWGKLGSIHFCNYFHEGQSRLGKDRVVAVDPEKNLIKFKQFEGDLLKDLKSLFITMQVTPKEGGVGSVVKWRTEYEKNDEKSVPPQTLLPFFVEVSREIDGSLENEE